MKLCDKCGTYHSHMCLGVSEPGIVARPPDDDNERHRQLMLSMKRAREKDELVALQQAVDAERWRFMMKVADNPDGPEAEAMDKFSELVDDADKRLNSDILEETVDKAMAYVKAHQ